MGSQCPGSEAWVQCRVGLAASRGVGPGLMLSLPGEAITVCGILIINLHLGVIFS